jgi:glycosyltransferase involved in cell wall biosynthesis
MDNTTRFSILIPCYNYAHYLGECLQSVIDQTIGDWEVVVVDDASTMGDAEVETAKFNDPRIRFIRHEKNRGAGATFNTAFNHSQNPYVLLLSADDRLTPRFLEKAGDTLENNPSIDVLMVDFQLFGDAVETQTTWNYKVYDAQTMTRMQWIPGPATIMKRAVWEKAGGHYEGPELRKGNLDWDFWLSVFEHIPGLSAAHIP